MGRVPYTLQGKMFEGSPTNGTNLRDQNSIQGAVKWTISNTNLATKNFQQLVSLAHFDLFDPKRTTIPVDAVSFRGYPTLTIELTDFEGVVLPGGANGSIQFNLNSNNRFVGYNYNLFIQAWSGDGFTPPEPDNPDSPSDNYAETNVNVNAGVILNQSILMLFDEVIINPLSTQAIFTIRVEFRDNSVDGANLNPNIFYFKVGSTETRGFFGDTQFNVSPLPNNPNPYPNSHQVTPLTNSDCPPNIAGSQFEIFSNSTNLSAVGSIVSLVGNVMDPVTPGFYSYGFGNTTYILQITLIKGGTESVVFSATECDTSGPIE